MNTEQYFSKRLEADQTYVINTSSESNLWFVNNASHTPQATSCTSGLCLFRIGRVSILSFSQPITSIHLYHHPKITPFSIPLISTPISHSHSLTLFAQRNSLTPKPHLKTSTQQQMASTNSLQYLLQLHHHKPALTLNTHNTLYTISHSLAKTPSLNFKTQSFSTNFSALATSTSASEAALAAANSTSLDLLTTHLTTKNYREADDETRRLLIALAGETAVKRGYIFFSEVQFIPIPELKTINDLWLKYSDNKFGYSVQKSIWEKSDRDFSRFFIRVGWMKKLDTEVVQFNYRAFPNEFMWELTPETPPGHLPLTNALRGTQLLKCLLCHPAFDDVEGGDVDDGADDVNKALLGSSKPLSKKVFRSDYSF